MVMSSGGESGGAERGHRYELFEGGRSIGWLEWRPRPRERLGWYLRRSGGSPVRLRVDLAIDDLARAQPGEHGWALSAELAALLSTALALDAADRALHPAATPRRRPLLARRDSARHQIYTSGLAPDLLARAVPELPLASVGDVVVLEGQLTRDGLEAVLRRIQLLGGRVLAVLPAGSQP
jgi:hypothetical protein